MAHKAFLENDDQFIVSYELLYILQWLLTYEKEAFTHLVHKAFVQGNSQETYDQVEEAEYLQNSVIDFFSFLEEEVEHASENESMKHVMQKNLLKTLDHIDPKIFDPAIIKASMMATAERLHPQRNHQAKDIFLKQLLKKWTPKKDKNKKHSLH
ncbi:hypothetical protein KBC04_03440 [Candidatus Babeliales bacterium]|nr:hypothetical protein [Candidatus Babeliales bacterium]MBP9843894.1 hypothetical protein [Candidatus Babeliales bacterium]